MTPEQYLRLKSFKFRKAPGEWQLQCQFCDDTNKYGHLYVNRERGVFMCQRCGESGSFWSLQERLGDKPEPIWKDLASKGEVWDWAVRVWQDALIDNDEAISYLKKKRGLTAATIGKYRLGWAPKNFMDTAMERWSLEELKRAGLVNDDNYPVFWNRLMIPYFQRDHVATVRGKQLGGNMLQAKDTSLYLFAPDNLRGHSEVYLCEGELDAMLLDQMGYPAAGLPGALNFQEHWATWFDGVRRLFVVLDADEAGRKGAAKVEQMLGRKTRSVELPVPTNEKSTDITEYFLRDGHVKVDFDVLVDQARGRRIFVFGDAIRERDELRSLEGLSLGFPVLDAAITPGLLPGQVVTILAKTGVGKCLGGTSKILLESGELRSLKDMDLEPVLSMTATGTIRHQTPVAVLRRPADDVYRLTLRTGRYVDATFDHKLFVGDRWMELGELAPGDLVATPRRVPVFGDVRMKDTELTFLGLHLCDGTSSTKLGYFKNDSVLRQRYIDCLTAPQYRESYERCWSVYPKGQAKRDALDLLESHGLKGAKSREKFIPDAIFRLPSDQLAEFLGLVWSGDGSVEAKGHLSFSSSSERLVRDVQHLLLRFGVVSLLRHKQAVDAWELRVVASTHGEFLDSLGPHVVGVKASRLGSVKRGLNTNVDVLPLAFYSFFDGQTQAQVRIDSGGTIMTSARLIGKRFGRDSLRIWADNAGHEEALAWATSDVYWDEVVSIEQVAHEATYCLQMNDDPNFVANDLVVHNTAMLTQIMHNVSSWTTYDGTRSGLGLPTLVLSLEQTKAEIAERLDRIALLHNPSATSRDLGMWHSKLRICDENKIPPGDVRFLIEEYVEDTGFAPRLLIVDYLGYWSRSFAAKSKYEQVSEAVMELKRIAKDHGVVIIAPHQVSRMGRSGNRLELDFARDSGVVEETSDFVLALYRPSEKLTEDDEAGALTRAEVRLQILKSRHGSTGREMRLWWTPYTLSLVSYGDMEPSVVLEWDAFSEGKLYQDVVELHRGTKWTLVPFKEQ